MGGKLRKEMLFRFFLRIGSKMWSLCFIILGKQERKNICFWEIFYL